MDSPETLSQSRVLRLRTRMSEAILLTLLDPPTLSQSRVLRARSRMWGATLEMMIPSTLSQSREIHARTRMLEVFLFPLLDLVDQLRPSHLPLHNVHAGNKPWTS